MRLLSRSAQLLADGSVCDRPSASVSTGSYNFCRFAALGARAALRQRAGPAPCVGSTAAEDAAADEAALRREGGDRGAEYVDVDAFLAATPPDAPGGAADGGEEEEEQGSGREGGGAACVSALVALAGTDPAKAELWDLASGARACGCRWCVLQLTRLLRLPFAAECAVRLGPPPAAEGAERAGMLMALCLHADPSSGALFVLGGYEDGWCVPVAQCI